MVGVRCMVNRTYGEEEASQLIYSRKDSGFRIDRVRKHLPVPTSSSLNPRMLKTASNSKHAHWKSSTSLSKCGLNSQLAKD